MMMLACVTGSVLILKTSFMCRRGSNNGRKFEERKGAKRRVLEKLV
jgi:hypothetical protein